MSRAVALIASIVVLFYPGRLLADTQTSLGDNTGEGSGQFTGLTQTPEATLFTGAATTRIDIQIPPGHRNMTPKLALVYSSASGPSPFGFGWDLPIGRIERSAKWGVPRCGSSHVDDFVLILPSGTLELVNDPPGTNDYRPKIDQGFLIATKNTATNSWVVRDRGGLTYRFGTDTTQRTGTDTGVFLTVDVNNFCRFTTSWALASIEDRHGNRVDVGWSSIGNVLYPESISYGANPTNGVAAHPYHVSFAWEPRPDVVSSALGGAPSELTRRATSITVSTSYPNTQAVREYTLYYDVDDENEAYQSRLNRVDITGNSWPQQFAYSTHLRAPDAPYGHHASQNIVSPSTYRALRSIVDGEVRRTVLDMNGDAILDLVYYNGGSPWLVYFGYMNADGSPGGFTPQGTLWSMTNVPAGNRYIRAVNDCDIPGAVDTCTMRDTFDITGDGIPDYIIATTTPWTVYPGRRALGWEFGPGVSWNAPFTYVRRDAEITDPVYGNADTWTLQDTVDVNADGLPDLVVAPGGTGSPPFDWDVYLNTGSGFATARLPYFKAPSQYIASRGGNSPDFAVTQQILDLDGDGLLDFLIQRDDTVPKQCQTDPDGDGNLEEYNLCLDVYRGTGQGFSSVPQTYPLPTWDGAFGAAIQATLGGEVWSDLFDVSGDGLPDLITLGQDGEWFVFLNSGGELQSWGTPIVWPGLSGPMRRHISSDGVTDDNLDMIDLNGDGMLDQVGSVNGGQWTIQVNDNPVKPNLLSVIRNGLNGTATLRYQPSTMYSNTYLPSITWVVDAFRQADGLCNPGSVDPYSTANVCISSGHERVSELAYTAGLFDPGTREFRGFGWVYQIERNDPAPGQRLDNVGLTNFEQAEFTKGRVRRVDRYAGDYIANQTVPLVTRDQNTWSIASIGPAGRYQVFLTKNTKSQDFSGAIAHTVVREQSPPDAHGNVGAIRTYDGDGSNCVTTVTAFATPIGDPKVYDKPSHTYSAFASTKSGTDPATCGASESRFVEKWFFYDGLASVGSVDQGDATRVESAVDAVDRVHMKMQYDGFGNVTHTWDENEQLTHTTFDPLGIYPAVETNAAQHERHTVVDYRWGKPKLVVDPNDQVTCYGYDGAGRPAYVVRPPDAPMDCVRAESAPAWERYHYVFAGGADLYSSITLDRREPGQTGGYIATSQYFDALARPRYRTAQRMVADPPPPSPTPAPLGCPATQQTIISGDTEYDAAGRPLVVYDPYPAPFATRNNGATFTLYLSSALSAYDPLGRPQAVIKPDNGVSGSGRTVFMTYAPKATTTYDAAGNKSRRTVDTYGRTARVEVFANPADTIAYSRTDTTYDGAGRVKTTTLNGLSSTTVTHTYDWLGRKLSTDDPDSGMWTYRYDAAGNLIFQDDPKSDQHVELCYDAINRPARKYYFADDDPDLSCAGAPDIAYDYDDVSMLNGTENFGRGRLTHVSDRSGEVTLRYDERGRRVYEKKAITLDGTTTRALLTYEYDVADRIWKSHYPDGEVVESGYDETGQPSTLMRTAGSTSETIISCASYDLLGRAARMERLNGTVDIASYHGEAGSGAFTFGHALRTRQVSTGALTYLDLEYDGYDPRGYLTSVADHRDATAPRSTEADYSYDFLGRLRIANGTSLFESYNYDSLGNVTQVGGVTMSYGDANRPHQMTSTTGGPVEHDDNGNRQAKDGGGQTYAYDQDGRVTQVTVAGPPFSAVEIGYDYGGQKTTQVATGAANVVTRYYNPLAEVAVENSFASYYLQYYYFGGQRVASRRTTNVGWETSTAGLFDGAVRVASGSMDRPAVVLVLGPTGQVAGAVAFGMLVLGVLLLPSGTRRRVVGVRVRRSPAVGLTLVWVLATLPWPLVLLPAPAAAGGGGYLEWRHYHTDHLGSVQVITDGAGLNIENIRYTPYGKVRGRWMANGTTAPLTSTSRHEFTGYETETASGLEYAGARFYDPALGSFLSHDPAREFASPYSYVGGNPMNLTDPNGEEVAQLLILLLVYFGVGFAIGAISAAAQGADAGTALKAGAIAGAIAAVSAVGLGLVDAGLGAFVGEAGQVAFKIALGGAAAYGFADAARRDTLGGYVASVVAGALAVNAVYEYAIAGVAQGGSGATAVADPDDPLLFNKQGLHRVDAQGNVLESYGGVSGKGDLSSDTSGLDFSKATQVGDRGPIPEGNYVVNPRQIESFSSLSSDQRWESWKSAVFQNQDAPWHGGPPAWGYERVRIVPVNANTFGRSGFFVHGGWFSGSSGCIDLCGSAPGFFNWLRAQPGSVPLQVRYGP